MRDERYCHCGLPESDHRYPGPAEHNFTPGGPMNGAELIAAERERQVNEKGWTAENDDQRTDGSLLECADIILCDVQGDRGDESDVHDRWPVQRAGHVRNKYDKDHVRRLTIAGALIAAEIDRLQRARV